MRRREVIALLSGAPAIRPLVAGAQQAPGLPRIGLLWALAPPSRVVDAFRSALADLGYVDGRTAVLESRFSGDRYDRLPALAAELVRLDVDVLVAAPAPAVIAAKAASGSIPIVMIGVADPVGQGLVASLARPGGNVTGLSFTVGTETFGKSLELLKETVPNLRLVAVLVNPTNLAQALVRQDLAVACGGSHRPRGFRRCLHRNGKRGSRRAPYRGRSGFRGPQPSARGSWDSVPAGVDAPAQTPRRSGWLDVVRPRHRGPLARRRALRRQAPEGRQPLRSADSAANHLRARHQSKDRESARGDRMRRRELVASLAAAVWPLTTSAQQARTPVVGFLGLGSPTTVGPALLAAFHRGLAEAGRFRGGFHVALQCRLRHLSRFDATRFHGAST